MWTLSLKARDIHGWQVLEGVTTREPLLAGAQTERRTKTENFGYARNESIE
jgi:hypothetical protein